MSLLIDFVLSRSFLNWFPIVSLWTIFLAAAYLYFFQRNSLRQGAKFGIISALIFRFFYGSLKTVGQYYIWSKDEFAQLLINSPISENVPLSPWMEKFSFLLNSRLGYFLFYSWGRFWINVFLSIVLGLAFWGFLSLLKKHRERFFENGEVELGFLAALIVGWPSFVIFIPSVFVSVVLISIFRRIAWGELYTTLGTPFLLAVLLTLTWGSELIKVFSLTTLKI